MLPHDVLPSVFVQSTSKITSGGKVALKILFKKKSILTGKMLRHFKDL